MERPSNFGVPRISKKKILRVKRKCRQTWRQLSTLANSWASWAYKVQSAPPPYNRENSPVVKSFLAGSLSGTCSTIIFQPLDLLKTRIQTPMVTGAGRSPGMISTALTVIQTDKLKGLWRGVTPSLSRTVPGIGVYFCSLHYLRTNIGSANPPPLESMAMGMFARAFSVSVILPITVVKTRFECGRFQYRGVVHALVAIYRLEGCKGLFSGLWATLMRDAPFSGIYLMFYTQAKKFAKSSDYLENPSSPMVHFSCGIAAGVLASIVTQPADVIKTHMQVDSSRFRSIQQTCLYIFQSRGMVGFLKGTSLRTLRRTLMAAIAWTVYEQMMKSVGLT